MKEETKIFFKYVFSIKGFLEGIFSEIKELFIPKKLFIIMLLLALISIIFLKQPNGKYVSLFFLFLSLIVKLKQIYKSGDHIRWYREKYQEKIENGELP
jgi:hypothetical protein